MSDIPWSWWAIRSSGLTAWALLSVVVALGLLLRSRVLPVPPARLLDAHRFIRVLALGFLSVHLVLLLFDPVVRLAPWEILIPGISWWEPAAMAVGTVAFWLIVVVSIAFAARPLLGQYAARVFRYSHWAAYAAWPLATAHFVMAGTDSSALTWVIALVTFTIGVLLVLRGWGPRRKSKRFRAASPSRSKVTADEA